MKLYVKSLLLLLLLGTAVSCNDSFLDQTQTSDLNRETVFADSTYTANFLTGIYTDIGFDINFNRWTYLWLMAVVYKVLAMKLNFILRLPLDKYDVCYWYGESCNCEW